jgi:hypothetical protein
MTTESKPIGAHIVGRFPLDGPEDVFRTISEHAGPLLRSMPDGETETGWVVEQGAILAQVPQLETSSRMLPGIDTPLPCIALRDGARAGDVVFPELGYARIAASSSEILSRLKDEGAIRKDVRLQVNFPSPMTVVGAIIHEDHSGTLDGGYERAILREVRQVLDAIPHDQLTIGWDIPSETVALEGGHMWRLWFEPSETAIIERLSRVAAVVPDEVPMGFHVCLGSPGNKHVLVPEDARNQVALMNSLATQLPRPVNWLHAPVPRDVEPERYLAPYAGLDLPDTCSLYLGVVDIADGLDATRHRIRAAQAVAGTFGVATVCGLQREFFPRENAIKVLDMYATLAEPIAAG